MIGRKWNELKFILKPFLLYIVSLGDAEGDNDEIRELMEEWERRMAGLGLRGSNFFIKTRLFGYSIL